MLIRALGTHQTLYHHATLPSCLARAESWHWDRCDELEVADTGERQLPVTVSRVMTLSQCNTSLIRPRDTWWIGDYLHSLESQRSVSVLYSTRACCGES